jgi:pilus assembly protein CpaE
LAQQTNSLVAPAPPPTPAVSPFGPETALGPETARKIVAFVQDEDSAAALRTGLAPVADDLDIRRGGLRHAVRYFEKEPASRMAIVDIAAEQNPQAALDDLARVCPPFVPVIVLGDNIEIGFYRLLVNDLGVAEYLPKPLTRDAVQTLLLPRLLLPRMDHPGAGVTSGVRGGHVVAVCGARGGAGATTIAINVALELAEATKAHVVLLDLNLQTGAAALMLSAHPGPGLRIALADPQRADSLLLERTAIEVAPRLRLLAAAEGFGSNAPVTAEGVTRVLDLLRQKFNFVVVDLPIPVPPAMFQALVLARQVVVVLGPDVAGLRDAKALRNFVAVTTGTDRAITVLNRADVQGGLARSLIETGLGARPDITIPDFGKRMIQALNLGVPALTHVPALRRHLAPLVREISGVRTDRSGKSWLMRMLRR